MFACAEEHVAEGRACFLRLAAERVSCRLMVVRGGFPKLSLRVSVATKPWILSDRIETPTRINQNLANLIFLDFLGFGRNVHCVFLQSSLMFFCLGILLSRVPFLFAGTKPKKQPITITRVDRGGGIGDFQHCIVIARGQEERTPKTANVVGKKPGNPTGKTTLHKRQ